jgi:hypothetical protein
VHGVLIAQPVTVQSNPGLLAGVIVQLLKGSAGYEPLVAAPPVGTFGQVGTVKGQVMVQVEDVSEVTLIVPLSSLVKEALAQNPD